MRWSWRKEQVGDRVKIFAIVPHKIYGTDQYVWLETVERELVNKYPDASGNCSYIPIYKYRILTKE
jgi:hypothetical protein